MDKTHGHHVWDISGLREQIKANARLMYQEDALEIAICYAPESKDFSAKIIGCDLTKVFMEGQTSPLEVEALRHLLRKISTELRSFLKDEVSMKNAREAKEARQKGETNATNTTSADKANEDSDYLFLE